MTKEIPVPIEKIKQDIENYSDFIDVDYLHRLKAEINKAEMNGLTEIDTEKITNDMLQERREKHGSEI
jgi:anti-sigma28 factor (negative regulator of flagellin synthesis)